MRRLHTKALLFILCIGILVSLSYFVLLKAWPVTSLLETQYSPHFTPQPNLIKGIKRITFEQWFEPGKYPHYAVTFQSDGTAESSRTTADGRKLYIGRTREFPQLATWIAIKKYSELKSDCNGATYDTPVIRIIVLQNGGERIFATCAEHPISDDRKAIQQAILQAAARVKWASKNG